MKYVPILLVPVSVVLSLIGVRLYRLPLIAHSGMPSMAGIAWGTWSDSNRPQSNGE
jgi:hypothetical protein